MAGLRSWTISVICSTGATEQTATSGCSQEAYRPAEPHRICASGWGRYHGRGRGWQQWSEKTEARHKQTPVCELGGGNKTGTWPSCSVIAIAQWFPYLRRKNSVADSLPFFFVCFQELYHLTATPKVVDITKCKPGMCSHYSKRSESFAVLPGYCQLKHQHFQ